MKKQSSEEIEQAYCLRAAKGTKFPVDVYKKIISVTYDLLEEARDDLLVQHLVNRGFVVEVVEATEIALKQVFNPLMTDKVLPFETEAEEFVKVDDQFIILNNETVRIVTIKEKTVYYKSLSQMDSPRPIGIDVLKEMCKRKAWVKIIA